MKHNVKMIRVHSNLIRWYQTRTGVFGFLPSYKKENKLPEEVIELRSQNCNFYR